MSVPRQCSGPELPLDELLPLIQFKVAQFWPQEWNPAISRKDLVQEVVIRVLQRIGTHNPYRARLPTFVSRIVDSILVDLWREVHAEKRRPTAPIASLDELSESHREKLMEDASNSSRTRDLQIDVREEIRKLPAELAPLAEDLLTHGVAELAAKYALHRGTVHRKLQKLRSHWKDSPLRHYVAPPGND